MAEPAAADVPAPTAAASLKADAHGGWAVAGDWTRQGLAGMAARPPALAAGSGPLVLDGSGLTAFDSAGAWLLRQWLGTRAAQAELHGWPPAWQALMQLAAAADLAPPAPPPRPGPVDRKSVV